ncbi:MAG: M1 family peptidase [Bacteroidetes bacterium]|nr:M1 family peptidase [Bacteroidota bacterium]
MRRFVAMPLLLAALAPTASAQPAPLRRTPSPGLDVLHYAFRIALYDTSDRIEGTATVTAAATQSLSEIVLDLVGVGTDGKGMTVTGVSEPFDGCSAACSPSPVRFAQRDGLLVLDRPLAVGDTVALTIAYTGVPADGLVISRNRHRDRTFFGDNWPMRARYWLPTNDHLTDKATVTFDVSAPSGYRVVANGRRVSADVQPGNRLRTVYRSDVPIPPKVMVIGAAPFAVQTVGELRPGVPVESWVFRQDSTAGFFDYALALPIAAYFDSLIAPYPYEKLANVQSKTIYGGMENSGAIFYHEGSVTGDRSSESLLAHEIAHQWFGDGATEADWPHLWLSEGFATYLTEVYLERRYGTPRLRENMAQAREQVVGFLRQTPLPLVDTVTANVSEMLTANPYQRGAWVLHMLRQRVGDGAFFDGLRRYYAAHGYQPDGTAGPNATTDDFRRAMEEASGQNLRKFFDQWTRRSDVPRLATTHRYDARRRQLVVTVHQTQPGAPFAFPLAVDVGGSRRTLDVRQRRQTFRILTRTRPATVVFDPDTALLFEAAP